MPAKQAAPKIKNSSSIVNNELLLKAFRLMCTARHMSELYDERKDICARYVHSTSRGHEAIQLATALLLTPADYAYPYYRDDSILLGIGMEPGEIMLQMLAKAGDPFSGGRTYYCHPSLRREGFPIIPHQSSATGMQAIPATGTAHGLAYKKAAGLISKNDTPIVLCSIGDGAMTEGEVAEALQMAVLHKLPIIYLVQDNDWAISATKAETRVATAFEYAAGFPGMERFEVDGADFAASLNVMEKAFAHARTSGPVLVRAVCPLMGHHTSGVRREWYRTETDITEHFSKDPLPVLARALLEAGIAQADLDAIHANTRAAVEKALDEAIASPDPDPSTAMMHIEAPSPEIEEKGNRAPQGGQKTFMVDSALHALEEILIEYPEALFYGQDVGPQLGGVFREASGLSQRFGGHRVFNTPIQEAYIIGSTAGMSATGLKPIVEIQFADYFWPGMNQFVTELSKSCYLSMGQFPVSSLIRVPIGAYGGGGPYHSGSIESALLTIKGVKIVYPSNTADLKGLMKAAFLDPNPVVVLEHKGLYWSKVPGTEEAKTIEPDKDYIIPLGKARLDTACDPEMLRRGETLGLITYGMGVYWAKAAAKEFPGQLDILDLRTLQPLDREACLNLIKKHGKALVLTEEPATNSFAQSLAGSLTEETFEFLDAPIRVLGAADVPAVPLNQGLEKAILPTAEKVIKFIGEFLNS